MQVSVKPFGSYQGKDYHEILITSPTGTQISFCDLGARINRWGILNEKGHYEQIILGHQNAEEVFVSGSYYGATVGRVAGRIKKGQFSIDGKDYQVEQNDKDNHLHGGIDGLDLAQFNYEILEEEGTVKLIFTTIDPDGHNHYPGQVNLKVVHTYDQDDRWTVTYEATSDQATLFNPTNHVYFNLNGDNQAPISNHHLTVKAPTYLPLAPDTTPLGHEASVAGTVFDLRKGQDLATVLQADEPQFAFTKGFDHPFIVKDQPGPQAILSLEAKGRSLQVRTDQVALVIYTHGYPAAIDKIWGQPLGQYAGITFESQNLPDAINNPLYGDTVLRPGQTYRAHTSYRLVRDAV